MVEPLESYRSIVLAGRAPLGRILRASCCENEAVAKRKFQKRVLTVFYKRGNWIRWIPPQTEKMADQHSS